MIDKLLDLYKNNRELSLIEIAYFAISVVSFMVAGILALFSQPLGVGILIIPLCSLVAGLMNIVVWSLVKLIMEKVELHLDDIKKVSKSAAKTIKSTKSAKSKK